ncbi:MAG: thermonuclease family protein [Candidatus Woesearchaeota archaeon]
MKRVVLLLLLAACTYYPDAARYIIDGDTFVLNNGDTIRLAGIDAPEKSDLHYDRAAYELQRRIAGRQLVLEGNEEDRYGRKLKHVFAEGTNVNVELVKEGWARAYLHENSKYQALLDKAQEEARTARKGIWNVDDSSYKRLSARCSQLGCPAGTIAVASKYGDVYYNCGCGAALIITPENLACFGSIQDAIAIGLRETRKC